VVQAWRQGEKHHRGKWMAYLAMFGFGILIRATIMIIFIDNTFHQFQ